MFFIHNTFRRFIIKHGENYYAVSPEGDFKACAIIKIDSEDGIDITNEIEEDYKPVEDFEDIESTVSAIETLYKMFNIDLKIYDGVQRIKELQEELENTK